MREKQWTVRMPETIFNQLKVMHAKYCEDNKISVSFNAFLASLLEKAVTEK